MDISNAVKLYEEFAKFPQATSASISSCNLNQCQIVVDSVQSQRDLERAERVSFAKTYCVDVSEENTIRVTFRSSPHELNNEIWNKKSKSGQYRAVVRKVIDKKKEEKQYLEIWTKSNKIENLDLSKSEKHGQIYEPDCGHFGCLEWSVNEDKLLYVAEKKYKKAVSYFAAPSDANKSQDKTVPGTEFDYKEEWGEMMVGKHYPVLCILTISTGEINVIEEIPDNVSVGQARWLPNDSGVVFTGWPHEPYRLGILYFPFRKSMIFQLDFKSGVCRALTCDSKSSNNCRVSIDGIKYIYLQTEYRGPQMAWLELIMYNTQTKETTTLVERVGFSEDDSFPGIYTLSLPDNMYCSDEKRVVLNSFWRSQNAIITVNLETKLVTRLPTDNDCCLTLLSMDNDIIVAECHSPCRPHYLVIGRLPSEGHESEMQWTALDEKTSVLDNIQWKLIRHTPTPDRVNKDYPNLTYESVLVFPTALSDQSPRKLIVYPHGGPHNLFTASFVLYVSLLCKLGYSILLVNYRGSIGYGSDSVYSLPGKCGDQDVKDVQCAAMEVLEEEGYDKDRMFLWGGSHGGFIICHILGRYPGVYKAAVCRNPVFNIAAMNGSTDIVDWCYVEAGQPFDHSTIPSVDSLSAMWTCSPLQYADQITTPMMIMIGLVDKRVPISQSYELYKALKARNKTVRYIAYPENSHPIVKVDSEADAFINIYKWFEENQPAVTE